jgi:prepilin-type N-terminal cleavage/methylation domain-containing protein
LHTASTGQFQPKSTMETIRKKYTRDRAGFSFSELMIVLAIVCILAAIATPSFLRSLPEKRLRGAARNLYSDLQKARLLAVKLNTNVVVDFNTATGTYTYCNQFDVTTTPFTCIDSKTVTLESYGGISYGYGKATEKWDGTPIATDIAKDISFSSTGTAFPGTSYLQNQNQDICYAITTTNYGNVSIRRFNGTDWDKK